MKLFKQLNVQRKVNKGEISHHQKSWEERRKDNKKQFDKALKQRNKQDKIQRSKDLKSRSFDVLPVKKITPILVLCSLILLMTVLVVQTFNWTSGLLQQPVLVVDVEGEFKYLKKSVVADIVNESLESGYLQTDLPNLHRQLVARPWIKEASLKRKMNSTLQIELVEHKPLATWNDSNLISTEALLFTPSIMPTDLYIPHLSGQDYLAVLSMYEQLTQKIPRNLLPIQSLSISFDGGITIVNSHGMVLILEEKNWINQLERFVVISRKALKNKLANVEKIDMRYTNGAAVSWREQSIARINQ